MIIELVLPPLWSVTVLIIEAKHKASEYCCLHENVMAVGVAGKLYKEIWQTYFNHVYLITYSNITEKMNFISAEDFRRKYVKLITLHLPEPYIKALDRLVKEKYYPNRAEAIRVAVRDLLTVEAWGRTNVGKTS